MPQAGIVYLGQGSAATGNLPNCDKYKMLQKSDVYFGTCMDATVEWNIFITK